MKRIFIDLDDTIADYSGEASKRCEELGISLSDYKGKDGPKPWLQEGFFRNLKPIPSAIESFNTLFEKYDVYILSSSPWSCPWAASEKIEWVKEYLPKAYKRVILSHHKELCIGDYLIDDMTKNGASEFQGEHIQIGKHPFETWKEVTDYLLR